MATPSTPSSIKARGEEAEIEPEQCDEDSTTLCSLGYVTQPLYKMMKWRLSIEKAGPIHTMLSERSNVSDSNQLSETLATVSTESISETSLGHRKEQNDHSSSTPQAGALDSPSKRQVYVELPKDGIPEPNHERDEKSCTSSVSSLLSSYSGVSSVDSTCDGIEKLEKQFAIRDKKLKRLERSKTESYMNMLRSNEQAARELEITKLQQKYKDQNIQINVIHTRSGQTETKARRAFHQSLVSNFILFEYHHGIPALLLVLGYTFTSLAFYNFVNAVLQLLSIVCSPYLGTDAFQGLVLTVSLLVMRLSGYAWWWIDEKSYYCVKFDIHNRAKLKCWDTRLLAFFKRSKTLFRVLNLVSYNAIFVAVVHFYEKMSYALVYNGLTTWYESIMEEAKELAESTLAEADCAALDRHTSGYTNMFANFVCNIDGEWNSVQAVYDLLAFGTTGLALWWLGLNFLKEL